MENHPYFMAESQKLVCNADYPKWLKIPASVGPFPIWPLVGRMYSHTWPCRFYHQIPLMTIGHSLNVL